jgi:tRNA-splicing ligase RtcB
MAVVMEFARESRKEMMLRSLEVFCSLFPWMDMADLAAGAIDISHNYVAKEDHGGEWMFVHRKGAVHLPAGARGIVPGSMGTRSFVVEGRGVQQSFCSCSHGAGRAMSRTVATRRISAKDFRTSMEGVLCKHDSALIDEAPEAYKDIGVVMRGQRDLVKVLFELKPLLSVKGR